MTQNRRGAVLAGVCAVALVAFAGTASAQQVRLMTGPQGGAWYPLGGAIQSVMEQKGSATVQVLPGAGIANVKALQAGRADLGFGNSVSTVEGVQGRGEFEGEAATNVCNVATLYPQYFQIVAVGGGPTTVEELRGTSLAIQPRGNTGEAITADLLRAYDMSYDDMRRTNFGSYTDSVALMKDGNADVFTLGTTVPSGAVMDLASARSITVIPVDDEGLAKMQEINPGYQRIMIAAGSYPGQDADVPTIGYATHLIARCDLDEQIVFDLLEAMLENIDQFASIASAMRGLTPEEMAMETGVPLHAGAERFFAQHGVM